MFTFQMSIVLQYYVIGYFSLKFQMSKEYGVVVFEADSEDETETVEIVSASWIEAEGVSMCFVFFFTTVAY